MTWSEKFSFKNILSPNGLSVFRALLAMGLPSLVFAHAWQLHILAGVIFFIAAVTDYVDGEWARIYNLQSNLGKIVDPTADKFLILLPLAAFASMNLFSVWWIVPVFLREIVVTFCRIGWYMEGKAVGAEKLGKVKFVVQVFWVIFSYFLFLCSDFSAMSGLSGIFKTLTYVSMILAVFLTVISGGSFFHANRESFKSVYFAKFVSATGVGLIPLAPGTWGSALGIALLLLVRFNLVLYTATFFLLLAIGYWAVSRLDLSIVKDPGFVVMDEVCGVFITFFLVPISFNALLAGFFLFRIFDIIKPYPLRNLEKLPGYWGILCDDLGAGFYSWIIMAYFFI